MICSSNAQGGPIPKWRHKLRVSWNTPWPVSLSASWRYIGGVAFDVNQSNAFLQDPFGRKDVADAHIRAFNYLDLAGTWKVRDAVTVRVGVNNVLDKVPPLLDSLSFPAAAPPIGNGNTCPDLRRCGADDLRRYHRRLLRPAVSGERRQKLRSRLGKACACAASSSSRA